VSSTSINFTDTDAPPSGIVKSASLFSGEGMTYFAIAIAATLLICGVLVATVYKRMTNNARRKAFLTRKEEWRTFALSGGERETHSKENPLFQSRRKQLPIGGKKSK
jgi:uncharacterized RmlC-like cupin family protein